MGDAPKIEFPSRSGLCISFPHGIASNLQANIAYDHLFETTPNVVESVLLLVTRTCGGTVTCPDVCRGERRRLLEPSKSTVRDWLRPQAQVSLLLRLLRLLRHPRREISPGVGLSLRLRSIPTRRNAPHTRSCLTHHSLSRLLHGWLLGLTP